MSENKLIINTNGQEITRLVKIENNIITYDEKPRQKVSLRLEKDMLVVTKTGDINLEMMHVEGELHNTEVDINMAGQHFKHNVTIITKLVDISDDQITVKFTTDNELNEITYKLEGIKCILQK